MTVHTRSQILERLRHPEQGYRSSMGIKRLTKNYGVKRVEAACRRVEVLHSVLARDRSR